MNISFSTEQSEFKDRVVRFMDTHWEGQDVDLTRVSARSDQSRYLKEKTASWYQKVFDRGWALVNWPENSGGVDWDSTQKYIWMSECARRCIPSPSQMPGVALVGPILLALENNNQNLQRLNSKQSATLTNASFKDYRISSGQTQILPYKLR